MLGCLSIHSLPIHFLLCLIAAYLSILSSGLLNFTFWDFKRINLGLILRNLLVKGVEVAVFEFFEVLATRADYSGESCDFTLQFRYIRFQYDSDFLGKCKFSLQIVDLLMVESC